VFQCEVCRTDLPKYMKVVGELVELFPMSMECDSFVMLEKVGERSPVAFVVPFREGRSVEVRIGRSEENDLILNDMSISRKHAVMRIFAGGEVQISDSNSKFGTFVQLKRNLYNCERMSLVNDRFTFELDIAEK
jgi:pSer/pThr/pTyr-binding forkhead associated (FHA) protein